MTGWNDYVSKAAITLAVIGFLMTFAISYRSAGLAEGLTIGEAELDEFKTATGYGDKIQFSGDGEGTYVGFARDYGWLSWLFGISALGVLISRVNLYVHLVIISLVSAEVSGLLILYQLRRLIRAKSLVDSSFWDAPRNFFAYQTITYDWLLVGLTCSLTFLVTGILLLSIRDHLSRKETIETA